MKWTIIFYDGNEMREGVLETGWDATVQDALAQFNSETENFDFTVNYIVKGTPSLFYIDEMNNEIRFVDNQGSGFSATQKGG